MQKEDIKFQNSLIFEGMTSIRSILKGIDANTNTRRIEKIYYDTNKLSKIQKDVRYLEAVSEKYGFELIKSDSDFLDTITLGTSHGGLVASAGDRVIPYLTQDKIKSTNGFYAYIQGIEDPYNFGYALRSLYACGCDGIIVGERNWFSAAGVICRSSAGASELFEVYKSDDENTVSVFKSLNYNIICADERTENTLGNCSIPSLVLLVVGGEKRGISRELLEKADIKIKINYAREFRASLSAASATTMFAYEIMRQMKK